jgi:hypothetical protein
MIFGPYTKNAIVQLTKVNARYIIFKIIEIPYGGLIEIKMADYPTVTRVEERRDRLQPRGVEFDVVEVHLSNGSIIYAAIERMLKCCEDFGVEIDENIVAGMTLTNVKYSEVWHRDDREYDSNMDITATLTLDGKDYEIHMWNRHNGCYSHDILMKWDEFVHPTSGLSWPKVDIDDAL